MPSAVQSPDQSSTAALPYWHTLTVDQVIAALETGRDGLSETEARARLARVGANAVRVAPPTSGWRILLDQLRSLVVLLLVAGAAVSVLAGEIVDAIAILAVLVINALIGFFTELRARRAIEALARLKTPQAAVVRDGDTRPVAAPDLVPGDVIALEAGQAVPADARLISAGDLRLSEATLTGESLPVAKRVDDVLSAETPLAERTNMVYLSTVAVAGEARAVVVATGMTTELGRIGGLVSTIGPTRTPLERRLDDLGRSLAWFAIAAGLVIVLLGLFHGAPLQRLIAAGIALAVAAVPEGLPAVATITLALGVHRMARRRALARRLPSVEALGSVTVICTDKTGTLTAGEMTVTRVRVGDDEIQITGSGYAPEGEFLLGERRIWPNEHAGLSLALRAGALASRGDAVPVERVWALSGDPTDAAIRVAARKAGIERDDLVARLAEAGVIPFSSERQFMASFHRETNSTVAYVKGAPGRVLELSSRYFTGSGEQPLDDRTRARLFERNEAMARAGLRVIAVAYGPAQAAEEAALRELTFVGLIGMMDPPAAGVREAIQRFRSAGIRVVMLTGDQRLTAEAIARDLGILEEGVGVIDGRELDRLSDAELGQRITRIGAFSRVSPEAKLRIVTVLQQRGEIVAMLGDGVNDAAALTKSDVGVSMGARGTDVAKEAASIILQDDRFPTIVVAIEEGRVIFDNIRKFVFYLFSCNLGEIFVLVVAGAAGLPLPVLPLQILWLNLVTDTFPALALALEPPEPDVMARPPHHPKKAILSPGFVKAVAFYAALIAGSTLGAFLWGTYGPIADPRHTVTLSFMTLALAQLVHLGNARSETSIMTSGRLLANRPALGAIGLVLGLQWLAVYFAPLARLLDTYPLTRQDWMVMVPLGLLPLVVGQAVRLTRSRSHRQEVPSRAART